MKNASFFIIKNYKLREFVLVFAAISSAVGVLVLNYLFEISKIGEQGDKLKGPCILIYLVLCYYLLKGLRKITKDPSIKLKIKESDHKNKQSLEIIINNLHNSAIVLNDKASSSEKNEIIKSLLKIKKEELIDSAIFSWCEYGTAINKKFDLGNFFIVGYPMQEMLEECTKEKIVRFTMYINEQIKELDYY